MLKKISMLGISMSLTFFSMGYAAPNFSIDHLQVNNLEQPIGLDEETPFFGWQMKASNLSKPVDLQQESYQIIVKDDSENILWDSGRIFSGTSQNITYAGDNLAPESRYTWTVRVWDQNGNLSESTSTFETGLNIDRLGTGDWSNAKWIGSNKLNLDSHSLTVFKLSSKIQILPGSYSAGIVLGANDSRLMDSTKNLWHLKSAQDQSRIELVLDISEVEQDGLAKLQIYRRGYSPDDSDKPFAEYDLKSIDLGNMNDYHEISMSSNHGIIELAVDDEKIDLPQVNFWSKGLVINPAGPGGDYISFPAVADIGFAVSAGQQANFKDFVVKNYRAPSNEVFNEAGSKKSIFDGQAGITFKSNVYSVDGGENGIVAVANPSHGSMPMLRTNFKLQKKKIDRARIYATARGIYDLYVNGKLINETYFAPGLTQYDHNQLYQVYDVTNALQSGNNAIGAQLSEGWWSGAISFQGDNWNYFGDRQSLLAKLVVTYEDGSEQVIVTDPKSWQYCDDGPVVNGSFFQGEVYDATKEESIAGWNLPGKMKGWKNAVEIPIDESNSYLGIFKHPITQVEKALNYDNQNLVSQEGGMVYEVDNRTAKSVKKIADKVFIYDMGQNLAGVPNINIVGAAPGTKVSFRFAEMVYPANDSEHANEMMMENIRGALATDIYITKGGIENFSPRDTYHGYRYVEITGLDQLPLSDVGAKVLSSANRWTADYVTSDKDINRLFENIQWSTRANFLSIPTDCPQRNERMGWSGDLSVFAPTASYLWNTDRFLSQHLQAMRDLQDDSGRYPDIAPVDGGFGGIIWGSAGITVPWAVYQQYGDETILRDHYDSMKKYVDYLESHVNDSGIVDEGTMMQLGDWLGPENSKNDAFYLLTAQEIWDIGTLSKSAEILGKNDDAEYYARIYSDRKKLFNKKFFDSSTHRTLNSEGKLMDTQTSYAVALEFDLVDENNRPYAEKYLVETVERENTDDTEATRPAYSLMTGFIGTARISRALSEIGRSDIAYKLLENHQYPSWLYPVDQGATTIWERLNSYTIDGGFGGNNSMNSFNHYSFGAVGNWMMSNSLGIEADSKNPGWKHFILQPEPDFSGGMTFAKGFYDSPYGRINSSWQLESNGVAYEFDVPANTSAECRLLVPPTSINFESINIVVNGEPRSVRVRDGYVNLSLIPGHWNILVNYLN